MAIVFQFVTQRRISGSGEAAGPKSTRQFYGNCLLWDVAEGGGWTMDDDPVEGRTRLSGYDAAEGVAITAAGLGDEL